MSAAVEHERFILTATKLSSDTLLPFGNKGKPDGHSIPSGGDF
jgi:hypothetical protein